MKTPLTKEKKEIILEIFEKQSFGKYDGCINIANNLIDNGYCILPNTYTGIKTIWQGGIGKFIQIEDDRTNIHATYECVKYIFDLESFLKSNYFKEYIENKLISNKQDYIDLEKKLSKNKEKERLLESFLK